MAHPAQRQVLVSLLDRLGVGPNPDGGTGSGAVTGADGALGDTDTSSVPSPAASAPAATKERTVAPDNAGWLSTAGLVWGLGGLALGVVIALAGLRFSSSYGPLRGASPSNGPTEPGSSPVPDATPGPDGDFAWPPSDELSWPSQRR